MHGALASTAWTGMVVLVCAQSSRYKTERRWLRLDPNRNAMHSPQALPTQSAAILARLRARSPRVQCLTNTVAQQITANVLLAVGARVSMATHPDEVVDMTASADALLINLGTLDAARVAAIPRLLADARVLAKPRVLDPVFAEHSPLRRTLAQQIIAAGPLIVKGNAAELAVLTFATHATRVETGAVDRLRTSDGDIEISGGHPLMAQVTGLGCALGGLIAACAAVEVDPVLASAAALHAFGVAGQHAAKQAAGPGSFAVAFVDVLSLFSSAGHSLR
jgi:hydroxyethylthiazole kinase